MKKLFIILYFAGFFCTAQKVSNITYRQEQSNIIISYDLETKAPCKVSLYVSTNDGKTWQGPLTKVTGDVVDKITSGNNIIIWNVLAEFEELRGDNIKFQVKAIGSEIETIKIGTQEWSVKNLNVSRYRNGDSIPEVKDDKVWSKLTTGAWCYYNNDPENEKIYGKLYNWHAVNDPRGLAPEGYHIPTAIEFKTLYVYLGVKSMKFSIINVLRCPNTKYSKAIGFSDLADYGRVGSDGTFSEKKNDDLHDFSTWWTSLPGDKKSDEFFYYYPVGPLAINSSGGNTKCVWGLPISIIKN